VPQSCKNKVPYQRFFIALKQAVYAEPQFVLGHFSLGNLAFNHGKLRESKKHFENVSVAGSVCPRRPCTGIRRALGGQAERNDRLADQRSGPSSRELSCRRARSIALATLAWSRREPDEAQKSQLRLLLINPPMRVAKPSLPGAELHRRLDASHAALETGTHSQPRRKAEKFSRTPRSLATDGKKEASSPDLFPEVVEFVLGF